MADFQDDFAAPEAGDAKSADFVDDFQENAPLKPNPESVVSRKANPADKPSAAGAFARGLLGSIPFVGDAVQDPTALRRARAEEPEMSAAGDVTGTAVQWLNPYMRAAKGLAGGAKAANMLLKGAALGGAQSGSDAYRARHDVGDAMVGGAAGMLLGGLGNAAAGVAAPAAAGRLAKLGAWAANRVPGAAAVGLGANQVFSADNQFDKWRGGFTAAIPAAGFLASRLPSRAVAHERVGKVAEQQLLAQPDPTLKAQIRAEAGRLRSITGQEGLLRGMWEQEGLKAIKDLNAARAAQGSADKSARAASAKLHADTAARINALENLEADAVAQGAQPMEPALRAQIEAAKKYLFETRAEWTPEKIDALDAYAKDPQAWWDAYKAKNAPSDAEVAALDAAVKNRTAPDFRAQAESVVDNRRMLTPDDENRLRTFVAGLGGDAQHVPVERLVRGEVPPTRARAENLIADAKLGVERDIAAKAQKEPGERSILKQHMFDEVNPLNYAVRHPITRLMSKEEPATLRKFATTSSGPNPLTRGNYTDPAAKAAIERVITKGYDKKYLPRPETARSLNLSANPMFVQWMEDKVRERRQKGGR